MQEITVAGGGLAGCEAAWYLANKGYSVNLYEMRPQNSSPAHTGDMLGELVCSNSLKSENIDTAAGLLKKELLLHNSLLIKTAYETRVPAGSALAVDREIFSAKVTNTITKHSNINVIRREVKTLPKTPAVIACGPLASESITNEILKIAGKSLHFIDAISPVISADSIDMEKGYFAGRYNKGGADYLNLPMTEDEFNRFYDALINAETVKAHDFEDEKVFEKCMPIEVIASRGIKTLLFGPMRPVGLEHPETGKIPFAAVQLRAENKDKSAYNIVGFQTKMTFSAQKKVFSLIPGLENAEYLRYGTIHRNTYIDAPKILDNNQSFKKMPLTFLAGQITGVEGYLESMASGIMAAMQLEAKLTEKENIIFSPVTAFGALQRHIMGNFGDSYTPSAFHFGMLEPLDIKVRKKSDRKIAYSQRALEYYERLKTES